MIRIPGYNVTEIVHQSPRTAVYRAYRESDNARVALKVLDPAFPAPDEIARLNREYAIARHLDAPGIIGVYGLERIGDTCMIVMEDIGGESIAAAIKFSRPALAEALRLSIGIAEAIEGMHRANVIHKDINPSNIVWNRDTGTIRIIDFGTASLLPRERSYIKNPNILEGTLAYLSPEQTGRLNRSIDYRTDYYSLGVTLYELFTGQRPFSAIEPLEMIHCHIARQPNPPDSANGSIPPALSRIIMKLMAKTAEERYQSARSLRADLASCLEAAANPDAPQDFPIAIDDVADRFQIPQNLYGREKDIATLLSVFDLARNGAAEVLMVRGYAGIGKSTLVYEIQKPIIQHRAYYITGGFDQLKRDMPYSALITAFRDLLRQILAEGDLEIAVWREKLLAALGMNAQIVIDVLPELSLIIGDQPAPPPLPLQESQNRFNLVFQRFVGSFADARHPLVIFLDDLQWADQASLDFIEYLCAHSAVRHLLLIGSYRDNEVGPVHPLRVMLKNIGESKTINDISLFPLDSAHVTALVADTLRCDHDTVRPLAQLCHHKTAGNPFFLSQFLHNLYDEGLVRFDPAAGTWRWDEELICESGITDNVADLLARKFDTLPEETRRLLSIGACIGGRFDLDTLSTIADRAPEETAKGLWDALKEEMIAASDDSYGSDPAVGRTTSYRFIHDNVYQSITARLDPDERKRLNLRIGRLFADEMRASGRDTMIFDVVNHINFGVDLIEDPDERQRLAELNLQAEKKAKNSAAYRAAYNYASTGLSLLAPDAWTSAYRLALTLHVEAAESAYLCMDFETMERLTGTVIAQARSIIDAVDAYDVMIRSLITQNRIDEAVETGSTVLRKLGASIPDVRRIGTVTILRYLIRVKLRLFRKNFEELSSFRDMTDPRVRSVIRIIYVFAGVVGRIYPPSAFFLTLFTITQYLSHGYLPYTAYSFIYYAWISNYLFGSFDTASGYATVALNVLDRYDAKVLKAKIYFFYYAFIMHWRYHLKSILKPLLEGYNLGLETGDFEFGGYCINVHLSYQFFLGARLDELEESIEHFTDSLREIRQERACYINEIYRAACRTLRQGSSEPWALASENVDLNDVRGLFERTSDRNALFNMRFCEMLLAFLFGHIDHAERSADYLAKNADAMYSLPNVPTAVFYATLVHLAAYETASPARRRQLRSVIRSNSAKIKKWMKGAPMNFMHRWYLVEAERCRIDGRDLRAMELYDRAIESADQNEYLNDRAIANECAARFYVSRNRPKSARSYLVEARHCYTHWGALAKVREIETRYGSIIATAEWPVTTIAPDSTPVTSTTTRCESLDLATIMKISQALSSEIVLADLLTTLMNIAIESAGAQRGYLILEKNGTLYIEAEGAAGEAEIRVLQSTPLVGAAPGGGSIILSESVLNFVLRTRETVIVRDASADPRFSRDEYIMTAMPRSIMCLPFINQGKLGGILYLENNLIPDAFTAARVRMLELLSSQIAISIENARMYVELDDLNKNLERKVEERTIELNRAYGMVKQKEAIIEQDLALAQSIQNKILPAPDEYCGVRVHVDYRPMAKVGGDIYDIHPRSDTLLRVLIADATGHGVQAALVTMIIKSEYETLKDRIDGPADLLAALNNEFVSRYRSLNMFFTCVVVDIDTATRTLRYASAGHYDQYLVDGGLTVPITSGGKTIGFIQDAHYRERSVSYAPGARLFLFTDGATEEFNDAREVYGEERLKSVIQSGADVRGTIDSIIADIQSFVGDRGLDDDLTIIGIEL